MLKVNFKNKIIIFVILVVLGFAFRLLPHSWNFTPIGAIALFSGFYFKKKYAFVVPVLALFISDAFLGFYNWKLMLLVYGSFLLCVVLGFWLKKHKKWYTVAGTSIIAALLFFFITNFAVWMFTPWYAKTLSGIIQCYIMAIPFFRNTLLGNLFYVTVLFGAYEIVQVLIKNKLAIVEKVFGLVKKKFVYINENK